MRPQFEKHVKAVGTRQEGKYCAVGPADEIAYGKLVGWVVDPALILVERKVWSTHDDLASIRLPFDDGDEPDGVLWMNIIKHPVPAIRQGCYVVECTLLKYGGPPLRCGSAAKDAARQDDSCPPILPQ
jgi:hypothetical protein